MHRRQLLCCVATVAFAVASFVACASPPKRASGRVLEGTYWRLTELRGQPIAAINGPREPHIVFAADGGRVSGSAGCNRFSGPYKAGDRLELGPLMSTKMACADDRLNRQETDFLRVLQSTSRYDIAGDTLTLASSEERLARFVAVPK